MLAFAVCATGVARADVDTMGKVREVSSTFKSSPGGVNPFVTTENEDYECTAKYSDMQSGAFTWVIGNCAKGETLEAVVRRLYSDSEPEGNYALGGWVGGGFQGCGWIEDEKFKPKAKKSKPTTACSEIASGKYEVAETLFMGKHNGGAGDGYFVVNKTSCPEYANYRPWSSGNVEKELIRTAPAYATSGGSNYPALKWRYTTKYNSTDGTGQYVMVRDDRLSAGEGNWVFVPRSCLPVTLPENENERVPSPPTVSTGGISNLTPQGVTLHGTVNPNGLGTKYHFEYWGTGSPVSTPEGSAGSGTSSVEETAPIGLQPGTTYHYRFVATSATGTGTGSEQSFTAPGPVEAVTSAASGVAVTVATLNGTVNPRGYDARYHFEYGKSISYGTSTPEDDAGAGGSAVPESASIAGLLPGTTYHYRIAATSGGVTSYGADKSLKTEYDESELTNSRPTIRNPNTGQEWVFYVGSDSTIWQWHWDGKTWADSRLGAGGPSVAANSTPTAVYNATTGNIGLYYVAASGRIWSYEWTAAEAKWISFELSSKGPAAAANTSPSAVYNPSNGDTGVYYVASGGQLWNYEWTPETSWISFQLSGGGPTAAEHTSPSAVYNQSNGRTSVYYVASGGQLWNYAWSSETSWIAFQLSGGGPTAAANTSPTTVYNQSNGRTSVYYVASGGQLWNYAWSSETSWIAFQLGGGGPVAASSSSPTAVYNESNLVTGVYYVASGGQLWSYEWTTGTGWTAFALSGGGPAAAEHVSPNATYEPSNGITAVYYPAPGEQQWTYNWTAGTSWTASELSEGYALTEEASELKSREAQLNGTLNPRGTDAHYHFEYGATTSYGTSTPAIDAGSGTINMAVKATVKGLTPKTIYHYRIVATYTSGTTYGTDRTLTTEPAAPAVSPTVSAVRNLSTGQEWVFYVGSDSTIWQWHWDGKTWADSRLGAGGPSVAANSTPTAVYNATTGNIGLYYVAASGRIWSYEWTAAEAKWISFELSSKGPAAAANTSPSAVYNPSNGDTGVYYVASGGQLWNYEWTPETSWISFQLSGGGPTAAEHTSPSAVYNQSNGRTSVYYVASGGQLWNYAWSSETSWIAFQLSGGGPTAAANTSPTTVYNQSNGRTSVYYVASGGQLWNYAWSSETSWIAFQLSGGGPTAAANTSPSAIYNEGSLATGVYYVASGGQLWNYEWTSGSGWIALELTGGGQAAAANTSPYAVYEPSSGLTAVYYLSAANSELWQWKWASSTGWLNSSL